MHLKMFVIHSGTKPGKLLAKCGRVCAYLRVNMVRSCIEAVFDIKEEEELSHRLPQCVSTVFLTVQTAPSDEQTMSHTAGVGGIRVSSPSLGSCITCRAMNIELKLHPATRISSQ